MGTASVLRLCNWLNPLFFQRLIYLTSQTASRQTATTGTARPYDLRKPKDWQLANHGSEFAQPAFLAPPARNPRTKRTKLCENDLMQVGSSATVTVVGALDALADRLMRSTGACKVLVCSLDGAVIAHAGSTNVLLGTLVNELADLAADMLIEIEQASHLAILVEDRFAKAGALQVCAAPLGHMGLLMVLFPDTVDPNEIRVRVRRTRHQMMRILGNQTPSTSS